MPASIHVVHGSCDGQFDHLAGRSVGELRRALASIFNIPSLREGSKTKYLLYAVKDGQEQRELANASTHAFNWIKKHCK